MFAKLFALLALLAVAFAEPKPQVISYAAPGVAPLAYSAGYSGYTAPLAYAASPYAASAYPYAASAYPYAAYSGAYYVR